MTNDSKTSDRPFTLAQMRRVLNRYRGSRTQIARTLGIGLNAVSSVLSGRTTSARVMRECTARVQELIDQEERATVGQR